MGAGKRIRTVFCLWCHQYVKVQDLGGTWKCPRCGEIICEKEKKEKNRKETGEDGIH